MKNLFNGFALLAILMWCCQAVAQPTPSTPPLKTSTSDAFSIGSTLAINDQFAAYGLSWEYHPINHVSVQGSIVTCMLLPCTFDSAFSIGLGGSIGLRYWLNDGFSEGVFMGLNRNSLIYAASNIGGRVIDNTALELGYRFAKPNSDVGLTLSVNQPRLGVFLNSYAFSSSYNPSSTASSLFEARPIFNGFAALGMRTVFSADSTAVSFGQQLDYTFMNHFQAYYQVLGCAYVCHLDRWQNMGFGFGSAFGLRAFLDHIFVDTGVKVIISVDTVAWTTRGAEYIALGWRHPDGKTAYDAGIMVYRQDFEDTTSSAWHVGLVLNIVGQQ